MVTSRKTLFSRALRGTTTHSGESVELTDPDGKTLSVAAKKVVKTVLGWAHSMHHDPERIRILGGELLASGYGETAYEILKAAHKEFPKNVPLQIQAAETALAAELFDRARFEFIELRKRSPDDDKVVMGLALTYARLDDKGTAVSLLLETIKNRPGSLMLWEALLEIQLIESVADEVLMRFTQMREAYPEQSAPCLALAHYYERAGKEEESDRWLRQAEEICAGDSDVLRSRLRFGAAYSRHKEVINSGEKLLQIDVFDDEDLTLLFTAYLEDKRYEDCQGTLSLLELRFPNTPVLPLKRKLIIATRSLRPAADQPAN